MKSFPTYPSVQDGRCFQCQGPLVWIRPSGYYVGSLRGFCTDCEMYTFFDVNDTGAKAKAQALNVERK